MKEQITKFDLEAAFKALDEIEIPQVNGLKPNRLNLSETVKRVDRLQTLIEDYYDVRDKSELEEAQEDREAEVAQAKLARIEKIVDLDAESEDDILPSYVGKVIIQCPQCMTLFYKNPEDIERSEEDPDVVNINEVCQHCGNDQGYSIIGKVAEEIPEEPVEEPVEEQPADEELPEIPEEEQVGETEEENNEELPEIPDEEAEEEKVEESLKEEVEYVESPGAGQGFIAKLKQEYPNSIILNFNKLRKDYDFNSIPEDTVIIIDEYAYYNPDHEDLLEKLKSLSNKVVIVKKRRGQNYKPVEEDICPVCGDEVDEPCEKCKKELEEDIDKDLDKKLDEHNEYIEYLRAEISKAEDELKDAKNDFVKESIQRKLDALNADLDKAIPEEVKEEVIAKEEEIIEEPAEEVVEENPVDEIKVEDDVKEEVKESLNESFNNDEFSEFMDLAKKLNLVSLADIIKAYPGKSDKDLLACMRADVETKKNINEGAELTEGDIAGLIKALQEKDERFAKLNARNIEKILKLYAKDTGIKLMNAKAEDVLDWVFDLGEFLIDFAEDIDISLARDIAKADPKMLNACRRFCEEEIFIDEEDKNRKLSDEECVNFVFENDKELKHSPSVKEILDDFRHFYNLYNKGKNESLKEDAKAELQAFVDGLDEGCKDCKEDLASEEKIDDYIEDLPESCEGKECKEEICPECGKEICECNKQVKEDVSDAEFEAMLDNPIYNEGLEEEKCCEDDCTIHKAITHPEEDMKELKEEKEEEVEEVSEEEIEEVKKELPVEEVVEEIKEVAEEIKEVVEADEEIEEAIDEVVEEKVEEICPECEEAEEEIEDEENFDEIEELVDESINTNITNLLTETYSNVKDFTMTNCELCDNKFIVEGNITFNSGKSKSTTFSFIKDGHTFYGSNKELTEENNAFKLGYNVKDKALIVESFEYNK